MRHYQIAWMIVVRIDDQGLTWLETMKEIDCSIARTLGHCDFTVQCRKERTLGNTMPYGHIVAKVDNAVVCTLLFLLNENSLTSSCVHTLEENVSSCEGTGRM